MMVGGQQLSHVFHCPNPIAAVGHASLCSSFVAPGIRFHIGGHKQTFPNQEGEGKKRGIFACSNNDRQKSNQVLDRNEPFQ